MGREAVDRVDGGTDRNVMAEDADPLRAFDQASTERATSLVARDQHAAFASRQVVAQMVPDAAGVAHSAGGNDDRTRADVVERHRLLDAGGEMEPGKVRSEEHTSELQSLMRISYAVSCLKKKK